MSETAIIAVFLGWLAVGLLLFRRRYALGTVLGIVGPALALSLGRGFSGLYADALVVTSDPQLLDLLAIVTLIYLFSFLLKDTRRMEHVAAYLTQTFRDPRWVLVSVPALVGLIPMPGGAMFTAPITDEVGNRISLSAEDKVFSNYWFRHCWELAFPLYPGIILAAGLVRVSPGALALTLMPLCLVAFLSGLLVFFLRAGRPADRGPDRTPPASVPPPSVSHSWKVLWPILSVIALALAQVPLVPGLILIIAAYAWSEGVSRADFQRQVRESFNGPILLLVWAVFLFGKVLQTGGVLQALTVLSTRFGLPAIVLNFALPFLLGLLTGVTPGFVGTVFPLLIPTWQGDPVGWVQFAYAGGLAGVFLSPSHLCLGMTQEYFKADLAKILRLLLLPVAAVMAMAAIRLGF